ncbi:MAG: hypothetical protein ACI3XQ_04500 [Eubacteriales bacterium]
MALKRVILLLLLSAMCFAVFGCRSIETPSEEISATTAESVSDYKPVERNYNGRDYKILISSQMESLYISSKEESNLLPKEVYRRNTATESMYNINIKYYALDGNSTGQKELANNIRTTSMSQETAYDLIVAPSCYIMGLVFDDYYWNVRESEYINWERPWYNKVANDLNEIDGKLFGVSSSFAISQLHYAIGIYYNKEIYDNLGLTSQYDPYELVDSGNWTFETFNIMNEIASKNVDPDNFKSDGSGTYGYIGNLHSCSAALIASDTPFIEKSSDGELSIVHYNQHLIDVFDTYYDFYSKPYVCRIWNDDDVMSVFSSGNSLFAAHMLRYMISGSNLQNVNWRYGILPFPKYTAEQAEYKTYSARWELACIPAVSDHEFSSVIFEFLSYETYDKLIPVYFDNALQSRYADTEDDARMLGIIRDTAVCEFAATYYNQTNKLYAFTRDLIYNENPNLTSEWEANRKAFESSLRILKDAFSKMD